MYLLLLIQVLVVLIGLLMLRFKELFLFTTPKTGQKNVILMSINSCTYLIIQGNIIPSGFHWCVSEGVWTHLLLWAHDVLVCLLQIKYHEDFEKAKVGKDVPQPKSGPSPGIYLFNFKTRIQHWAEAATVAG